MDGRWDVHRPVTSTPPASTLGPFLPDPCLCGQLSPGRILTSVFSTRPLLFLVHMYSLSLPSHPHSATLHFSSTATAGLACASSACISLWSSSSNILNEPLLLQTGVYVFPFLFFFFLFYTRALGCYLIQCEDITWSLPEIICWIGEKEPWSPVIQTDTSLQTASIHPSTRTRRRESRVSSHQSSFISTKWQFLWVSGTVHSVMLSSWNMAIFNQREPYLRKILMNQ